MRLTSKLGFSTLAFGALVATSCNAGTKVGFGGGGGIATSATAGSTTDAGTTDATTVTSTTTGFMTGATSTGTAGACNVTDPNVDMDGDGYTPAQGDCNDCDPNVNPGAVDVPPAMGMMPVNSDCAATFDPPQPCDGALAIDSQNAADAAKAIDLCKMSSGAKDWGLVGAKWVLADGTPPPTNATQLANFHLGHGILPQFGANIKVRKGMKMLALSSGTARNPTDPGYQNVSGFSKGYTSGSPGGFPKESPACPGVVTGQPHDSAGVELLIQTPTNATGIAFDFDFFTYEWPNFVCSQYNDFFVALLTPFPMGQTDGNISFDMMGNPISVNNAFLGVCGCTSGPPCQAGGKTFACALGDTQLIGTGFGKDTAGQDHGSTGWLTTQAPVKGGSQIHLRFTVYDSGDGVLDTTTLVDNFRWIATPGTTVMTNPTPM